MTNKIAPPPQRAKSKLADLAPPTGTSEAENLNPLAVKPSIAIDDDKVLRTEEVNRVRRKALSQPSQINFRLELDDHVSIIAAAKARRETIGEYIVKLHRQEVERGG